jgi:hypothetical protein
MEAARIHNKQLNKKLDSIKAIITDSQNWMFVERSTDVLQKEELGAAIPGTKEEFTDTLRAWDGISGLSAEYRAQWNGGNGSESSCDSIRDSTRLIPVLRNFNRTYNAVVAVVREVETETIRCSTIHQKRSSIDIAATDVAVLVLVFINQFTNLLVDRLIFLPSSTNLQPTTPGSRLLTAFDCLDM